MTQALLSSITLWLIASEWSILLLLLFLVKSNMYTQEQGILNKNKYFEFFPYFGHKNKLSVIDNTY